MALSELLLGHSTRQALAACRREPGHALLLTGPNGSGKTLIASALAADLLGLAGPEKLDDYPYFRRLSPLKGSIAIDTIRGLNAFFGRKVPSRRQLARLVIIEDADTMTTAAGNALLKLLEEPPVDTVFVLTSSRLERILPTIRSRTRLITIAMPGKQDVVQFFADKGYPADDVDRAWLISGGNISGTAAILDGSTPADVLALVKHILSEDSFGRLLAVDSLSKDKEQTASFVAALASTAEASLASAATKNTAGIGRWHKVLKAAHQADQALIGNGNAKLVLTELMLAL